MSLFAFQIQLWLLLLHFIHNLYSPPCVCCSPSLIINEQLLAQLKEKKTETGF